MWVTGAYKGWLYWSPLHTAAKPFRRVIFDEIHDLVESKADGSGTDAQTCFIQLTRPARNTWLVTATPFPKGDLSVYGLHQVLGFKRLRLHCEYNSALPRDHPFEIIKRKLYVKNHASVWIDTLGAINVVKQTVKVQFQVNEAAFYHSREANVGGGRESRRLRPAALYNEAHEELRRLCCHPGASQELQAFFNPTGQQVLSTRGFAHETIDSLTNKMLRGRKAEIEELKDKVKTALRHLKCAVNSIAICEAVERKSATSSGLVKHEQGLEAVVRNSALLADCCKETNAEVCMRITQAQHEAMGGRDYIYGEDVCTKFILESLASVPEFKQFLATNRRFVTVQRPILIDLQRKLTTGESQRDYFGTILEAIGTTGSEGIECSVCLEPSLLLAFPACGHYTCSTCMDKWMAQKGNCPQCRKQLNRSEVMSINCGALGQVDGNAAELAKKYGSKPAALIVWLRKKLVPGSKVIIFSMWDDVLHIASETLRHAGIPNSFVEGSREAQVQALEKFTATDEINVLMLSSLAKASGTNLQCANHIVFIDPPGHTAQHGAALERQAIGRVVRIGQKKGVTVTRFEVEDTLEEDLYKMNSEAYASLDLATTLGSSAAGEYVCDMLPSSDYIVAGGAGGAGGGGGGAAAGAAVAELRNVVAEVRKAKKQRTVLSTTKSKPLHGAAHGSVGAGGGGGAAAATIAHSGMAAGNAKVDDMDSLAAAAITATDNVAAPPPPPLTAVGDGSRAPTSTMEGVTADVGGDDDVQVLWPPLLPRRSSAEGLAAQRAALQQRQHVQQRGQSGRSNADPDAVANLVGMGFSASDAATALLACDGNVMRALDMILTGNLPVVNPQ